MSRIFPVWRRILVATVIAVAALGLLLAGFVAFVEHRNRVSQDRARAVVVAAYRAAAERGEVAKPLPVADAVRAVARCAMSLPNIVLVKTAENEVTEYWAESLPPYHSPSPVWKFRLAGVRTVPAGKPEKDVPELSAR